MKIGKNKTKVRIAKNKGITLIALVVTIMVLIILATISIYAVLGENGLIKKAEKAKDAYEQAKQDEQNSLDYYAQYLENHLNENGGSVGGSGGGEKPSDTPEMPANWDASKVNAVKSEDNIIVPVPIGYTASTVAGEKSVASGFVIEDASGNQFVWVPVSNESFANMFKTAEPEVALSGSTGVKSKYYSNLRQRSGGGYTPATVSGGKYSSNLSGAIREPDLVTKYDEDTTKAYYAQAGFVSAKAMAEGLVKDYTNMRASIEKYEGFYIGRYELTGTVDVPTVKAGAVLANEDWYGLYKACRGVKTNENVTSTMIWGCQWDETMNWLKNTKFTDNADAVDVDSSSWGNYKDYNTKNNYVEGNENYISEAGSKQITGFSPKWSANNIYDLAGNYNEWIQEASDTNCRGYRGGFYNNLGSDRPASDRSYSYSNNSVSLFSARATLYINL